MLRNYLKTTWRNLTRHTTYTLINVLGLAIALACFSLFYLYFQHEMRFDRFHEKSERMYRLGAESNDPMDGLTRFGSVPMSLCRTLGEDFPEVEEQVSMFRFGQSVVRYDDKRFNDRDWLIVTPGFFQVFDFHMIAGDTATALKSPKTVVLTETTAKRLFGEEEGLGKTIWINRFEEVLVTGIIADPPPHSHIQFSMLIAYASLPDNWQAHLSRWDVWAAFGYMVLKEGTDIAGISAQIPALIAKHRGENQDDVNFFFQPMHDVRLHSKGISNGLDEQQGSLSTLYIFIAIGLFLLLIAAINYMNLATARALQRAKEIGLRKVVGASRLQLVTQLLGESVAIALVAFIVSIILFDLALPAFNEISGRNFSSNFAIVGQILPALLGAAVLIGMLAGSIPAWVISGFQPVDVLKRQLLTGLKGNRLRQGLVITQFVLSIIMISATLIVFQQMDYIQSKELGFRKSLMVVVDINDGSVRSNFQAMKEAFLQSPDVQRVSATSRVPGEWKGITQINVLPMEGGAIDSMTSHFFCFDKDAIDVFEMEMVKGENFRGQVSDSLGVLINETAARLLGWDDPIGKRIRIPRRDFQPKVVGVVKDFHFKSLHEPIGPLIMGYWRNPVRAIDYFTLQISPNNIPQTINHIKSVHEQFDKNTPIEYNFLDDKIALFYEQEEKMGNVFGIGALLTIIIACMGLFGLASYTVERRTREIGIRKILGATTQNLLLLLSRHFAIQVLVAFVLASPIAYFLMKKWLENFAYQTTLHPGPFVAAGLLALAVALLTVSYRSYKAAQTNPVEILRVE